MFRVNNNVVAQDYIAFNSTAPLAKAIHEVLVLLLVSNPEDAGAYCHVVSYMIGAQV